MRKKRLGETLLEHKRISTEHLEKMLREQQARNVYLGELLFERNLVTKDNLVAALEEVTSFPYVDCRYAPVETAVLEIVPHKVAARLCAMPLIREGKGLVVVMAEPQNLLVIDELRFTSGMEIIPRLGFRSEITAAIEEYYHAEGAPVEKQKALPLEQVDVSNMQFFSAFSSEKSKAAAKEFQAGLYNVRTPAVLLVSSILSAAAAKAASDIHIEPQALDTLVRIRVDGVLQELTHIPNEMQASLVSRVKILADMDIAERRAPQDGRFLVQIGERKLDLRVSTLPTHYGEKIVLRILDPKATRASFTDLGLSEESSRILSSVLALPQGMALITGPTGSGKTTTLYSALNLLRSSTVNIVSVEDPVEYKIEDVTQVQVNLKAGRTFANCLRSMLRQDPNIIVIGEIRDGETAEIALQAAQTGHLVLSTLHTNDSIGAITRLIDLGVPAFLMTSSLTAILAQRLVRKLCTCRREAPLTEEYSERLLAAGVEGFEGKSYTSVGCAICESSGYKGRTGIFELLVFDEQIREGVRSGEHDEVLRNRACRGGMRLMQDDALEKIKRGITTFEEVMRVVPFERVLVQKCPKCAEVLLPSFHFCPYCGAATNRIGAAAANAPASPPSAEGVAQS